jgi:hypothetical protein
MIIERYRGVFCERGGEGAEISLFLVVERGRSVVFRVCFDRSRP